MAVATTDIHPKTERTSEALLDAWSTSTPIGTFTVIAHDGRVVAAGFDNPEREAARFPDYDVRVVADLPGISDRIDAYFAGDIAALDEIPVDPSGSARRHAAWDALRKVRGTTSYAGYARLIEGASSPRSAARACATNPITLIVPCHRVIRSDGSLGGYYWGLAIKQWLLDHEARFTS